MVESVHSEGKPNEDQTEGSINKQQLKADSIRASSSMSREETEHLVISIDYKGFSSKYIITILIFIMMLFFPIALETLKMGHHV